jgi:hypothetical protein
MSSVFTSRILATDSWQSHCNWSTLWCLLRTDWFLSCHYSVSCQLRRLNQFPAATANSGTQLNSNFSCVRSSLYSLGAAFTENTASSSVACWFTTAEMCLPHSCVATRAARITENTDSFASTEMCLQSRCLTMNYFGFQVSCHILDHDIVYLHIFRKKDHISCIRRIKL